MYLCTKIERQPQRTQKPEASTREQQLGILAFKVELIIRFRKRVVCVTQDVVYVKELLPPSCVECVTQDVV
jgi:hypothetical protein